MRLLAAALAGRTADSAALARLFGLFVLATFTVELGVMALPPWIVGPDMPAVVARGFTHQQIADRLYVSLKTVESYRAWMMAKLGLKDRAELTRFALETGLLGERESED